jgi:hypothetical protein
MVFLGDGRVGWAYLPDPAATDLDHPADCNSNALQLTVYTSASR